MRHWTQDGAHITAGVMATVGMVAVVFGLGWPALCLAAVGALLLGLLRALETRDGFMQAVRAETNSHATQAELDSLKARVVELEKPPLTARVGSGNVRTRTPEY